MIESVLGAGGMGEVYRARDTRLDRHVAIKVLRDADPNRQARLSREGKALAALSHPHICILHDVGSDDGTSFLVMEYLEGVTLAHRLERGALPMGEALRIAIQIADALDKAHRSGIVHRDLKPSNVMLSNKGTKLLDFGIARLHPPSGEPPAMSATRSTRTIEGTIVGTVSYMAPEQLEGRDADARSDLFAFGCVLYEMLAGCRPFEGGSQAIEIAHILDSDAPPISPERHVSPALDRVIRRCLAKDPDDRWQTARDLLSELEWLQLQTSNLARIDPSRPAPVRERAAWAIAATATMVSLVVLALRWAGSSEPPSIIRMSVAPPEGAIISDTPAAPSPSVSPDGKKIAFVIVDKTSRLKLVARTLSRDEVVLIAGTEGAARPFWSPDSQAIAFFSQGKLKKVALDGGAPEIVCDAPFEGGGSWLGDTILFGGGPGGIMRVAAKGGTPVPVTRLRESETAHTAPTFLPDGRHFIFLSSISRAQIGSIDAPNREDLFVADSRVDFTEPGYLAFVRGSRLMVQRFDADRRIVTGEPVQVADGVGIGGYGRVAASMGLSGTLAYRVGSSGFRVQLTWRDRSGRTLSTVGDIRDIRSIALSPDAEDVAYHIHENGGGDIWMTNLARGITTRFTFEANRHYGSPCWPRPGGMLVYERNSPGRVQLFKKARNGTEAEEVLLDADAAGEAYPTDCTDSLVMFQRPDPKTQKDLWILPLTGDRKPYPLLHGPFNEDFGTLSPDLRWFAYGSDETGRFEIYVQPFPPTGAKWPISLNGGAYPRWRSDGRELFYLSADGQLMAVTTSANGSEFSAGAPNALFDAPAIIVANTGGGFGNGYQGYAPIADASRFLVAQVPENRPAGSLTVVVNALTETLGGRR
jgi:serine/threonine protein kinase